MPIIFVGGFWYYLIFLILCFIWNVLLGICAVAIVGIPMFIWSTIWCIKRKKWMILSFLWALTTIPIYVGYNFYDYVVVQPQIQKEIDEKNRIQNQILSKKLEEQSKRDEQICTDHVIESLNSTLKSTWIICSDQTWLNCDSSYENCSKIKDCNVFCNPKTSLQNIEEINPDSTCSRTVRLCKP